MSRLCHLITNLKILKCIYRSFIIITLPLSQSDSSEFDEVSHARSDDDGLLIRVAGLVVALHLLHHELGVTQQGVFSEAVEVQSSWRDCRLKVENQDSRLGFDVGKKMEKLSW